MDKVLNSYESLFIVNLANGEDAVAATVDKFTSLISTNAEIVDVAKWGKRRLAYPINDLNDGYYVVVTFKSEAAFPAELERLFNIDESILRSLTIRLDYDAAAAKAKAESAAQAAALAAQAAAQAAAQQAQAEQTEAVTEGN